MLKQPWIPKNKPPLVIVYIFKKYIIELYLLEFVENVCIYIHEECLSVEPLFL